jgi:hypothetical protein
MALALSDTTAEALDLRSWDQRIDRANKRFVVLEAFDGEAVLDKETQLVWQREAVGTIFFFRDDAAMSGNEASCLLASTGGRHGWRLPSIHELNTLVVDGVLPAGHPFLNVQTGFTDFYWSATVRQSNPAVTLGIGFDGSGPHIVTLMGGDQARVWCVRGPGGDAASY